MERAGPEGGADLLGPEAGAEWAGPEAGADWAGLEANIRNTFLFEDVPSLVENLIGCRRAMSLDVIV